MAAATFSVQVTVPDGSSVTGFNVHVSSPVGTATTTFHVTATGAIPYLQVLGASGVLRTAQLGRVTAAGTGIDWLSPDV